MYKNIETQEIKRNEKERRKLGIKVDLLEDRYSKTDRTDRERDKQTEREEKERRDRHNFSNTCKHKEQTCRQRGEKSRQRDRQSE